MHVYSSSVRFKQSGKEEEEGGEKDFDSGKNKKTITTQKNSNRENELYCIQNA